MVKFNFHQLRLFHTVARSGSISRAAKALRIAQPSVSTQLREFESRCGVELFERGPRGVRLTDAGLRIFDYAERIFALEDDLGTTVLDLQQKKRETLIIGGSLTAGEYFLPTVARRFNESYPAIESKLVLDNSSAILTYVSGCELDLGFVGTDAVDSGLVALPCWQDEIVIIVPPGSPASKNVILTLSSLQSQTFVMREPGSATRQSTEQYLRRLDLSVKTGMTVGSPEAVKRHVTAGLGWGFASKHSVTHEVGSGQLAIAPVQGWDCRRSFYAVHRKDGRLNPSQQEFLKFAQGLDGEFAVPASV